MKNENLSLEIINLVNANRELSGNADNIGNLKGTMMNKSEKLASENERINKLNIDLEE